MEEEQEIQEEFEQSAGGGANDLGS